MINKPEGQVMTLLRAGHQPTAMALTWVLAVIDQAPAIAPSLRPCGTLQRRNAPSHWTTLPETTAVLRRKICWRRGVRRYEAITTPNRSSSLADGGGSSIWSFFSLSTASAGTVPNQSR